MRITLQNGSMRAVIDSHGAELKSLKDRDGKEYIWCSDPTYWGESSPVLFPIVGCLRNKKIEIEGKPYEMLSHGFAKRMEFSAQQESEDSAVFTLCDTEETRSRYPYPFILTMLYRLTDDGLTIRYRVTNPGDKPSYYCIGAHPAFNCPLEEGEAFTDYEIVFPQPETADLIPFDLQKSEVAVGRRKPFLQNETSFSLSYDMFCSDALIFDEQLQSKSVSLKSKISGHGVTVGFEHFPLLAFWTPIAGGAPFLCIEPWCGIAVCEDEGDTLTGKRCVQRLAPQETGEHALSIKVF